MFSLYRHKPNSSYFLQCFVYNKVFWVFIFYLRALFLHQLAVFIYYAVWKPQKQWVTLDEGIWNSPLTYKPECRQEAWRFISYMFVHAG